MGVPYGRIYAHDLRGKGGACVSDAHDAAVKNKRNDKINKRILTPGCAYLSRKLNSAGASDYVDLIALLDHCMRFSNHTAVS